MADELLSRGVAAILPSVEGLCALIKKRSIRVYLGIDPTGSHLHLGHAVVLRKLNQFANAGHDVILLVGNGTVRIGDPTGRDASRPILTDAVIEENFQTWKEQASRVVDFSKITIKRNGDWLDRLTYADLVKLMAQTTVQQLIERDMFQDRLQKGLPIFGHEIMYPLLQGYDSVAMDVDLEIGGTDQTFNMLMGRQLQKIYNNKDKWVLTTPIINGTDGRKMSKSYGNFVALTASPEDMYGKLMSIPDSLIIEYFTLLTDVSTDTIASMNAAIQQGENPMQFKKQLARQITSDLHSPQAAQEAEQYFKRVVQEGAAPIAIEDVKILPGTAIQTLKDLVAFGAGLSKAEASRLIVAGGVSLDGDKCLDPFASALELPTGTILKIGKRTYRKVINTLQDTPTV